MGDYYQQEEGQQVKRELVIDAANERNYNNEDVPHSSLSEIMNPSNTEPEDDTTLDIGTMLDEGDIPLRAQRIMQEYFQNSTPTHYDAGDVVVESCACDMDDRSYDNIESFEN